MRPRGLWGGILLSGFAAALTGCSLLWGEPRDPNASNAKVAHASAGCPEKTHQPRPLHGALVDTPAEIVQRVPPSYPDIAREAGVDGTVLVDALVCEHGNVVDTHVQKSIPMLDAAAADAVMRWKFKPATYHGRAVPAWLAVPVKFSLH